ncbi:hypothetical protein NM688_g1805 [Phlebia brevispora]|uniref:Uncharacterized protein n=1 Tax=Phlebia brevispora TaxID=194682 RepID=A0ACC1TAG7_9APHY|nr:hypothetical protein NM688_g1805 [Phlebia brevispora]
MNLLTHAQFASERLGLIIVRCTRSLQKPDGLLHLRSSRFFRVLCFSHMVHKLGSFGIETLDAPLPAPIAHRSARNFFQLIRLVPSGIIVSVIITFAGLKSLNSPSTVLERTGRTAGLFSGSVMDRSQIVPLYTFGTSSDDLEDQDPTPRPSRSSSPVATSPDSMRFPASIMRTIFDVETPVQQSNTTSHIHPANSIFYWQTYNPSGYFPHQLQALDVFPQWRVDLTDLPDGFEQAMMRLHVSDEPQSPRRLQSDSPLWHKLPGEVLEDVVRWLVVGYHNGIEGYGKAPSLVCRDWRRAFLPSLGRVLRPTQGVQSEALVSRLAISSALYQRTETMMLDAVPNMRPNTMRRLTFLLPAVTCLYIWNMDWRTAQSSHPSWGRIFAGSWSAFTHVTELSLFRCRFLRLSDLFRLIATPPSLSHVYLHGAQWKDDLNSYPQRRHNPLWCIRISHTLESWQLMRFWAARSAKSAAGSAAYPGITSSEAHILTQIARCLQVYPRLMTVKRCPFFHATWVIGIHNFETFIARSDAEPQGSIRWIVFHFETHLSEVLWASKLATLRQLILQLPHLEQLVLIPVDDSGFTLPKELEDIADKIHVWSRNAAQACARDARRKGFYDGHDQQLPISPNWLEESEDE